MVFGILVSQLSSPFNKLDSIQVHTQMQRIKLPLSLQLAYFHKSIPVQIEPCHCDLKVVHDGVVITKLRLLAECIEQPYLPSFVANYLLLKLNNLFKFSSQLRHFNTHLAMFYNTYIAHPQQYQFRQGHSDRQLMAQILLVGGGHQFLSPEQLQQVMYYHGLVTVGLLESERMVRSLFEKSEIVVTLGLVSLHARTNPFLDIVHKDKNHEGERRFAARINQLIHLDPKVDRPNLDIVQDAYSLRCTPQVHGVAYDLAEQIQEQLQRSIDKPQGKFVTINGVKMRNLLYRSQCESLLLDSLVCALNEIGHMSFLRTERMLNRYLTKNNVQGSPFYKLFMTRLKKVSVLVSDNRKLAGPTNADTVIMDNYIHDIFVDEGSPYTSMLQMNINLRRILALELTVATEVLATFYGEIRMFKNDEIQELYQRLFKGRREGDYWALTKVIQGWLQAQ